MEDLQTQTPEPTKNTMRPPKKAHGIALNLALCLVVVTAGVAGVYYWQHQKVNDLSKKNSSLVLQLASAQKASKSSQSSGGSASNTISYKADVGKFTLTLPSKYAIVKTRDGGGEGRTQTSLEIGLATDTQGVVSITPELPINIFAYDMKGSTFRALVDAQDTVKDSYDKSTLKIDGVDAEMYKAGGFAAPQAVYFTKNNIFYTIDMGDADPVLDAIIAGFKFD